MTALLEYIDFYKNALDYTCPVEGGAPDAGGSDKRDLTEGCFSRNFLTRNFPCSHFCAYSR